MVGKRKVRYRCLRHEIERHSTLYNSQPCDDWEYSIQLCTGENSRAGTMAFPRVGQEAKEATLE